MQLNETLKRIQELMNDCGYTMYRLAKESDIPYSSLNSLFNKNNRPTITTLMKICSGLNVTLSDFFSEYPTESINHITKEERYLVETYRLAPNKEKEIIKKILAAFEPQ